MKTKEKEIIEDIIEHIRGNCWGLIKRRCSHWGFLINKDKKNHFSVTHLCKEDLTIKHRICSPKNCPRIKSNIIIEGENIY